MAVQQEIAFAFNRALVGRRLDVLIDGPAPRGQEPLARPHVRRCPRRRRRDFVAGGHLEPGDLVACEIVGAEGYDLIAQADAAPPGGGARPRPEEARNPFRRSRPRSEAPGGPTLPIDPPSSRRVRPVSTARSENGVPVRERPPDGGSSAGAVLERPQHADPEPSRPGVRRLRADRAGLLPVGPGGLRPGRPDRRPRRLFRPAPRPGTAIGRQLDPLVDKVSSRGGSSTC